jgi:hypothetical protein
MAFKAGWRMKVGRKREHAGISLRVLPLPPMWMMRPPARICFAATGVIKNTPRMSTAERAGIVHENVRPAERLAGWHNGTAEEYQASATAGRRRLMNHRLNSPRASGKPNLFESRPVVAKKNVSRMLSQFSGNKLTATTTGIHAVIPAGTMTEKRRGACH